MMFNDVNSKDILIKKTNHIHAYDKNTKEYTLISNNSIQNVEKR